MIIKKNRKFKFLRVNEFNINFKKIIKIIKNAGKICLEGQKNIGQVKIEFKDSQINLVTEIDKKVENYLIENISRIYPAHNFFGEETGNTENTSSDYLWIIDPIDGTNSFIHNQYHYSISVALQYRKEIIFGVVYAPKLDDFYFAQKGQCSYLNFRKIKVSGTDTLIESMISVGFVVARSGDDTQIDDTINRFSNIMKEVRGVRRFGSAALDLCYVACGSVDGYFENGIHPYDIAAGMIIVREAGGKVSDYSGGNGSFEKQEILASNSRIHDVLLEFFKD